MRSNQQKSRWVLAYVGFLALLSFSTSLMGYFAPDRIFMHLAIPFDEIRPVTFFYATRNVGIFALCVFGIITRDAKVLASLLLMRFVVELLDLVFTIRFGIGGFNPFAVGAVWIVVFLIPEGWAFYTLYRQGFAH